LFVTGGVTWAAGFFMHEIDAHSIKVLEFPRLREIIGGMTLSPFGRRRIDELYPGLQHPLIERSLRQSAQMRDIIHFEEALPLIRIDDISEAIEKSRIEGVHLEPKVLLQIKLVLDTIISLSAYGKPPERAENFPDIVEILSGLHPKRNISVVVGRAIDPAGEILSSASSRLAAIRREISDTEAQLKQHLIKILGSRRKHAGWTDDVITIRDGRYVIPVLSGEFRNEEGIVHDKSQSGATLYVEPSSAIPINNKLRQTRQDERLEIDRILRELTAMVGEAADDIMADLEAYGLLDGIHAKATFALKIGAVAPHIVQDSQLRLVDARHPFLIYAAGSSQGVVPLSVTLDRGTQGILITGPNTGGKTVALKTIGLLTLMTMSGLEIPAHHSSTIGIYDQVYADIGDEQSLELSLSTFSSHIRNIIAAVKDANERTLVLFDEVGAGTDPKEGASLAEVIILNLLERGCNLIATTHYSQLKTLPLEHPGLVNASLEFDRENLRPTFRLKLGVPGSSYAIDIARRLGLPDELADRAAQLLGSQERSLDSLIEKFDRDLDRLHQSRTELEERLARARDSEQQFESQKAELAARQQEIVKAFAEKYEIQLLEAKREIDRLVKDIRQSQAESKKIKESQTALRKQQNQVAEVRKAFSPSKELDGRLLRKGDVVWIEKFGAEGEVVEMIGDKKARVAVGAAFITVDTIDLVRKESLSKIPKKGTTKGSGTVRSTATGGEFNPELMLRGLTVEEALEKVDKFLDDAVLAGVGEVYIIHGKGTGTLRRHLSQYLKNHAMVESIRIGDWNEGGLGVTIARLKA